MTRRGAKVAPRSKVDTNLRPHGEPVPVKMMDIALPGCQLGRLTISCTTSRISVNGYHVLIAQLTFEECTTRAVVKIRWDGSALALNARLLSEASPAICKLMVTHCLLDE